MHTRRSCWYDPSDDCSVIVGIAKAAGDLSQRRSDARKGVSRARPEEWRGKPRTKQRFFFSFRLASTLATDAVFRFRERAFFDTLAGASGGMADPPKYVYHLLPGNEDSLIRECLDRRPWWRPAAVRASGHPERHHLWWGANGQKHDFARFPPEGVSPSMCNRLRNNREACVKTRLAVNLRKYAATLGREKAGNLPWAPTTFVLHAGRHTQELDAFRKHVSENESSRGPWIVKPGASNRGRGIALFRTAAAVEKHLAKQKPDEPFVAQTYLARPLLVRGRKFDVRVFVLVAPDGGAWIYRDSYVRTCTTLYTLEDLTDVSAHLTNDAVQKRLDGYGKHEDCNKLSFAEFQRALDADADADERAEKKRAEKKKERPRRIDFSNDVWPEIERITACALGATLGRGAGGGKGDDALRRRNLAIPGATFELFGLDFMLARDGSPALIEINTSPALFRHGAVLRSTLPEMMEEVCRLTLDRVFPPPTGHDRVKSASGEKTENEEKEKARFRELDVVVDLAVESSKSAVRARRSSASPEKKKKPPVPRAATRANSRVVSFGKGVGSDPAA